MRGLARGGGRPSGQKPAATTAWTRLWTRNPLCHQAPSSHWVLAARDGRHQRSSVLPRLGGRLPRAVRVPSGAGVCPPGETAHTPPPLIPPRLAQCCPGPRGLSVPGSGSLVSAAGLAQQRRQPRAHERHVGGAGREENAPPLRLQAAAICSYLQLTTSQRFWATKCAHTFSASYVLATFLHCNLDKQTGLRATLGTHRWRGKQIKLRPPGLL
jgi:hypothetical protein